MKDESIFYKSLLDNLYDGVYFVDRDRRITYWNKGAERITGYAAAEVLGKHCFDNILMHTDREGKSLCRGVCPLAGCINDRRERSADIYLKHKDGHRVRVNVRVATMLDDKGAVVGGIEIFTENMPAAAAIERLAELERIAYIDSLTGLPNRRYAEITLHARMDELQRYGWLFGVIFIDIDNFKSVNDRYGHQCGDEVLKTVAKTLQNSVRSFDVISRWGGEEYLAVIANVEGDELVATANRCRALVEGSFIPAVPSLRVTISLGATLASRADSVDAIVTRADRFMYESKKAGRNRVTADQLRGRQVDDHR
ncbi:MAG: diguanylate cyclase [Nitrospirae bacterium GWD2_57_9]|nr:MAG: diguanylate cyclase [Nitrospirae bacterium GWD2_57_9]OGW49868.1 MAG: diguanylate cyclase [Nitrospirae bacterium GWC2_57_9]